ncbi:MAG: NAD(+) synthase [Oscillospiraceae bacterium]|nr:NAD(+) synthase [Oscillospiraceae bacterium]
MKYGFIKVAAASPALRLGDTAYNLESAKASLDAAEHLGANLLVLPELHLTGYTCGDLFYSDLLLDGALEALGALRDYTAGKRCLLVVGLPLRLGGKLYNCAAVLQGGEVLGLVPKTVLPNYGEFYEKRQFTSGADYRGPAEIPLLGQEIPFGRDLLFCCREMADFVLGVEICEDLWAPVTPSTGLCLAGATVIANLSASNELIGKGDYRKLLISSTSARLLCGYVYANAGCDESTQDMVFSGHCLVYENGQKLAERPPFGKESLVSTEIDLFRLRNERHRNTSFDQSGAPQCRRIAFSQQCLVTALSRSITAHPFVPADGDTLAGRAEEILSLQASGLRRRIEHTGCRKAVVGISGGLDSTLALLVMVRAMDALGRPRKDILAVTMPCFGTTRRTRSNAEKLCEELGVDFMTVNISAAVRQHFADIGHSEDCTDVTYENCQARERTQVLMDLANRFGGIVVGTGDLSELALGWATYNGDHMSMYGVNCSVPKTLVRYIIGYEMRHCSPAAAAVLKDILDTPVSPELLPAENGEIAQKTEDIVGPYELHDFFLYHMLRSGAAPARILHLACYAFRGTYDRSTLLYWLRVFLRRFFAQQFKRSCLPDGPKVGTVTLSPRGDWRMPSDASARLWLEELDRLENE